MGLEKKNRKKRKGDRKEEKGVALWGKSLVKKKRGRP